MKLLHRRGLVCRQAVELVTDYLEGSLSARARRRFEAHLAAARTAPSIWPRCARRSA